jgi:hypothetical protein
MNFKPLISVATSKQGSILVLKYSKESHRHWVVSLLIAVSEELLSKRYFFGNLAIKKFV